MKGDVKIAETAATHSCAISHGDARDAVHENIPSFAFVCKAHRTVQQNPQGTKHLMPYHHHHYKNQFLGVIYKPIVL